MKSALWLNFPRACLVADQLALEADFFSFGTNDLTQMTYGFSRDDIGKFIGHYKEKEILPFDPFQSVDQDGVGELMRIAISKGRQVKPELPIGICGEVGGDPASIPLLPEIGVTLCFLLISGSSSKTGCRSKRHSKIRSHDYFAILAQEAAQSNLSSFLLTAIFCVRFHK